MSNCSNCDDEISDKIDHGTIEALIDRAIENGCFIEVISLVHNTIELYLQSELRVHLYELHGVDETKETIEEIIEKVGKQAKLLYGIHKKGRRKYLYDYNELCYMFGLIDDNMFEDIIKFNEERNDAIHHLLTNASRGRNNRYRDITETAKLGRKIQLKLSPLGHSEKNIETSLKKFEISEEESAKDPFLKAD